MLLKQSKKYLSISNWDRWWEKITDVDKKKTGAERYPWMKTSYLSILLSTYLEERRKVDYIVSSDPIICTTASSPCAVCIIGVEGLGNG